MKPTFDIFISYRRKDSDGKVSGRDIAARIKNAYENRGKACACGYCFGRW